MDCVKGALKTSFMPEIVVKQTHQPFSDDLLTAAAQTTLTSDDFFVDELLDFSKASAEQDSFVEEEEEEQKDNKFAYFSVSLPQKTEYHNYSTHSTSNNFSVPQSELCVPVDDSADLEWLSHFVEDSFSGYSLSYPVGKSTEKPPVKRPEPVFEKPSFSTPVQTKARSKRARTGGRVWSFRSEAATSSSSSSCSSSPLNTWLVCSDPTFTAESLVGELPAKKQKRRLAADGGAAQPRRCSHCLVQKTPQWRAGPLGAKTLCNACGVRYKSGRLLPEYRPACSPTFSSEVHSNNHRKVLEMRRKKEGESETGLVERPVQSF